MPQLLVRNIEERLVKKLKAHAKDQGISAEEAHRRLLRDGLLRAERKKPTLMEFLLSQEPVAPDIELDITREIEPERDTGF